MARQLSDWLEGWLEYTAALPSPDLFKRWSGIFTLTSAMERRFWIMTGYGVLYPNLYMILVGPPAVGKTVLTSRVRRILTSLGDEDKNFHLAPSSVTDASIINELVEAERRVIMPDMEAITYNALTVVSNDLQVLLPEYDVKLIGKLTDIWDNFQYGERRRTKDLNFNIPNPLINLLAATTPSHLTSQIPDIAWDGGFLSRTLIVFSDEKVHRKVFDLPPQLDTLGKKLLADLKTIFNQMGEITFTPEAIASIEAWNEKGLVPVPEHPKLLHYNNRRLAQVLKLCMIASMARGDDRTITRDDYARALDWLLELELYLPDIFKAMASGGDSKIMDECWYFASLAFAKDNHPVHEGRIIAFLAERAPAHSTMRIFDVMVKSGILIPQVTGKPGNWYQPKGRKPGT